MEKHDLRHEFPQFEQKITELKTSNHHFRSLFEQYQKVNNQIYRIEMNVEVHSDELLNALRHERVNIKDQIFVILTN